MSDTHIETKIKNINIDGVENCNLLCKLIIDYEPSKKCLVKNMNFIDEEGESPACPGLSEGILCPGFEELNKTYLEYPPGSFMNYQNTSYEATRVFFFHPSRHTIDRERFDFEVNIYHGVFKEGEKQEGMVSHAHYKSDNQARTTYNRDYHYHDNTLSNDPHLDMYQDNSQKNLVSCILFNRDDHKGHHANVFFNQFVNHPEFKNKSSSPTELKINTHAKWSLEDLLPKRRSFFLYDDNDKKNTYVVFDSINSIDHGILEILKNHKYAEPQEYLDTKTTVLYKNNIEVITDERYKADMRDQIKQLIGIHRTSMRISNPLGSADDYNRGAAKILMDSSSGGSHSRFTVEKKTAKELLDKWKEWGEGKNSDMTADSIYSSLEGSKITATDFKRDSLNKKLDNFEDVYQSMDQDYLDAIEKIFVTIYHPTLKEKIQINDEFKKIENIRKFIYQYNCIFLEQKKYVLETTEIKKSELMFDKPFNSLHELLLNLNFYKYQEDKTISIVGYEGNFNIYKTPKTGDDDSNGPKYVSQGLFEAPDNISKEELDDKIVLVENVNIVEYKIRPLGNQYVFNQISDGAEGAVGEEKFYFAWRYLINFQSTISYNKDRDILAYQSVIMDENLTVTENLDIFRDFETQPIVAPEYIDFQPKKGKIIYNLLKYLNGNDDLKSIKFRYGGDELDTTIDGDKCQEWNSNEVHHEGSALLSSHPTFPKEGKTFESLNRIEKEHLRNGLFDYTETAPDEEGNFTVTLKRHNKCRNPYNRKSGPWCYTTNPKKRWAYCVEPDHQGKIAKFILLFTFVMCIILAYLMVKVIFRYEYFTKFMAALTGGQMGEGAGASAGAGAGAGGTPATGAE